MNAALLVGRVAVLAAGQAGDLVEVLGVDIQNHQLVALGSEDDLLVTEPLTAEHLVGVGLGSEVTILYWPKNIYPFDLKNIPKNLSFETQITSIFSLKPNFCAPLESK